MDTATVNAAKEASVSKQYHLRRYSQSYVEDSMKIWVDEDRQPLKDGVKVIVTEALVYSGRSFVVNFLCTRYIIHT